MCVLRSTLRKYGLLTLVLSKGEEEEKKSMSFAILEIYPGTKKRRRRRKRRSIAVAGNATGNLFRTSGGKMNKKVKPKK